MRVALITGIAGQDGSYLAELLLAKGYQVHGAVRSNTRSAGRTNIAHLGHALVLHEADLQDSAALTRLLLKIKPNEVYNLAAQSHVDTSFAMPEYTCDTNGMGALRLLEAVKLLDELGHPVRYYQAGTSEMFGEVTESPQNERTRFAPRSPYAVSKAFAHWMTVNFRQSYRLHASNGILFNHESPRRGTTFVTRKITLETARVMAGLQPTVRLGNLDACRDWGHSRDYVEGMWLMLQQPEPGDYVLATGSSISVREFCEKVAAWYDVPLEWDSVGGYERGRNAVSGQILYESVPEFFRPCEVERLRGDAGLAREKLGWKAQTGIDELIREMCSYDRDLVFKATNG